MAHPRIKTYSLPLSRHVVLLTARIANNGLILVLYTQLRLSRRPNSILQPRTTRVFANGHVWDDRHERVPCVALRQSCPERSEGVCTAVASLGLHAICLKAVCISHIASS
jgi:hypothetical protein